MLYFICSVFDFFFLEAIALCQYINYDGKLPTRHTIVHILEQGPWTTAALAKVSATVWIGLFGLGEVVWPL